MTEKSLVEKASEFLSANVGDKMTINLEQLCQAVVELTELAEHARRAVHTHCADGHNALCNDLRAAVKKYSEAKDD